MNTVLGIDVGTQSVKVVFYDFANRAFAAVASAPLDLHRAAGGVAEQEAGWWTRALGDALGKIDAGIRRSVRAIAVSGQQHGFVPLDKAGKPLIAAKLWCDTSTKPQCREIMHNFGSPDACLEQVGNLILPGYTASKVRWFREAHPQLYAQMATILLPHDYMNFYLTGERCMEAGDASGTGFLGIRERAWSAEMLRAIDAERDLRECLPELLIENRFIGEVTQTAAAGTGLPAGTPVAIGGGDNMMGAIGTGNVGPGRITMSLGTSGTVYAYSDRPVVDPKGNIAAFCSSTGGWLPLLCTMNCTVTTENLRRLLNSDIEQFESRIAAAEMGAEGVLTLPFFDGERTPNLPDARASIMGLDSGNCQPQNLLRSGVEGATFALRFGIDELRGLGIETREIVLTGGGANSPTWRQIVADICNAPVTIFREDEGAAFGAALQALAALEGVSNTQIAALTDEHLHKDPGRSCDPRQEAVGYYEGAYKNYQDAVAATMSFYS